MDSEYVEEIIKQLIRIANAQEKIAKELETANNRPAYFYDKSNNAGYFLGLVNGVWGVLSEEQENNVWIPRIKEEQPKIVVGQWESVDSALPLGTDVVAVKTADGRVGTAIRSMEKYSLDKWINIRPVGDYDKPIKPEEIVMWSKLDA